MTIPPNPHPEQVESRFWLIIREPGMVPDRKGPWELSDTAKVLREFMKAHPYAFIDYLTVDADGVPEVEHGPEVLQMADGRSMSVGRKHNQRVRAAAVASLANRPADDGERMREALLQARKYLEDKSWDAYDTREDNLLAVIDAALPPQPEGVKRP